jgi:regulator of RNase E activity RraA
MGESSTRAGTRPDPELRYNRDSYHAVIDLMRGERPPVTDEQLDILKTLPFEAAWTAVIEAGYANCYVTGLKSTRPAERMAGRALTMRFLPSRPDLDDGVRRLSEGGGFSKAYYVRLAEESNPGDVLVADLGGDVPTGGLFGDVTALGAQLAGARGAVIWGSTRDFAELAEMENFPVLAVGFDPRGNVQTGVDWNVPVRVSNATVLPGDVVLADSYSVLFFPPQLAARVIERAREIAAEEKYVRNLVRRQDRPFRELYPMSPELRARYREEREKR